MVDQHHGADVVLKRRARLQLELGRVQYAFVRALPVGVAAGLLALAMRDTRVAPAVVAVAVVAFVVVAGWRSRSCLAGAVFGLALGVVPFLCMRVFGCESASSLCCESCGVGGLLGGVAIGLLARRSRFPFDVVAGALGGAALHLAVGCASAGSMEALGLLLGAVMGAAPVLALRRAFR
jgi:hypothetical protein